MKTSNIAYCPAGPTPQKNCIDRYDRVSVERHAVELLRAHYRSWRAQFDHARSRRPRGEVDLRLATDLLIENADSGDRDFVDYSRDRFARAAKPELLHALFDEIDVLRRAVSAAEYLR
ncbi:MAG TPA: hypothetical protein VNF29_14980 [Candidatus Binataceae bacterium]|nr:hypothetical protein [Candidatus Binataceae bacterium]